MATKLTKFDRPSLKLVEAAVNKALTEVAEQFGVSFDRKPGRFSESNYDGRYNFQIVSEDGVPAANKANFEKYAPMFGLDPGLFGFTYIENTHTFTVVGLNLKAPKNCVKLERDDGASFCCPAQYINRQFELQKKK